MLDMTIGSLFSGIDGLALGLERAGLGHTAWHAEVDPNASSVLASHWPDVPNLDDVSQVDWAQVEPVDVLCGGFPCQPSSSSGKRKGRADDRWLWPEMARAIRELRPRVVVVENVPGLLSVDDGAGFADVLADLATLGYDAAWGLLGAWQVGACHRRDRVFIVAVAGLELPWRGSEMAYLDDGRFVRRQASLFGAETQDVWPRAGMLRHGTIETLGSSPWTVDVQPAAADVLLPTPQTAYTATSVEAWADRRPAGNGQPRRTVGDLGLVVKLLPTPTAANPNEAEDLDNWLARRDRQAERGINGNGMGVPLGVAVRLLPTPVAGDAKDRHSSHKATTLYTDRPTLLDALDRDDDSLPQQSEVGTLLPTPRSSDTRGAGAHGEGGADLRSAVVLLPTPTVADSRGGRNSTANRSSWEGVHTAHTLCDIAYTDRFGEYAPAVTHWAAVFGEEPPDPTEIGPKGARRLSPHFVRWMQGFDPGWCDGLTRTSALKCFGNAVVPQVAQVIGGHVAALLGQEGTEHDLSVGMPAGRTP